MKGVVDRSSVQYRLYRKRKKKFLENLAKFGNMSGALKAAGWSRSNMKYWQEQDKTFDCQIDLAKEKAADALEAEAVRRAVEGDVDYATYQGEVIYHRYPKGHEFEGCLMLDKNGDPIPVIVKKYSDRMLELLLKANKPERFRDNNPSDTNIRGGVLMVGMMGQPSSSQFLSWEDEVDKQQLKYRESLTIEHEKTK